MDAIRAVHGYIERMVREVEGMKVLLVDRETAGIISCVCPQSYLLEHEVYLVDYLERGTTNSGSESDSREPLRHLKSICLLRPTSANMDCMVRELADPKYYEYHLCTIAGITNLS